MNRLANKVAIVTGGAHGIGAAIVQRFSEEGARVVLVDVNREGGEAVAARYGATFSPTDVANHAAVGELIAKTVTNFGRLDCVVSNACLHQYAHVEQTPPEMWERVIAVNLSASYHLAHFAAPHLRQQTGASIILISSVQAIRGLTSSAAYAASKGGQLGLMHQLAVDLSPQIRVNAILPGTIRSYPESITPEAEKQIGSWHLVGRIGECVEIANGCVFLASDEASFITGHQLVIDGGVSVKGPH
ncbi:MAG: SDR family oxidoreductase [Caldilineaceae bacterium]